MARQFPSGVTGLMSNVEEARKAFVTAILATDEYQEYAKERNKVRQHPDLKAQIDDYRKRNYELQSSASIDFEKLDQFEKEYEIFRENSLVADFLAAELGFCRLMQKLNMLIVAELDFE